jgi:hypothetical protein
MNDWDDERASITGREIHSNIPPKAWATSARERKRLFLLMWIVPGAVAFALLLRWLAR